MQLHSLKFTVQHSVLFTVIVGFLGDRVVIEPINPCKRCDFCKSGRYNLCKTRTTCSIFPEHGFISRFHVHDADFCYK